jgi:sugar phosphate isomerase/epimerase
LQLGLYTDSVPDLTLVEALDLAVRVDARAIEISTGGTSTAPHLRIDELLGDDRKLGAFRQAFEERGLRIAALNCSGWPLHPTKGETDERLIRSTILLAERLGVEKLVTMAGNPGDGPSGTVVNWIFYPWPSEMIELRERQWDQAIRFWRDVVPFAESHGIQRIAFELHPLALVYNVPTLQRLREAAGSMLGANMDPSHLFWQQMDPIATIRALGPLIHHVHLKDTAIVEGQVALAGVLDQRPFTSPSERAWNFRAVGGGHGARYWSDFVAALEAVGYDDALCIENEDVALPGVRGVEESAAFMRPILAQHASAS